VIAGHAVGSWSVLENGRAPQLTFPGVRGAQSSLAWYDSAAVSLGDDGPWQGYGASLGQARGIDLPSRSRRARSILDLRNGSFGYDENSLTIERGDSARWIRAEALSGSRDAVESFAGSGRHVWGIAGATRRGHHVFQAEYAQRGAAASLVNLESESVSGESWRIGYGYELRGIVGRIWYARAQDGADSQTSNAPSHREADTKSLEGTLALPALGGDLSLRGEYRSSQIARTDGLPFELFDRRARSAWAAARLDVPLGSGRARLELGGGHQGQIGSTDFAPAISYRVESDRYQAKVGVERLLDPVWSDLAPDVAMFMQRTWAGELEAGARFAGTGRAHARFLFGRTQDRALIARLPLEEMWLREGIRRDRERYDFGLLELGAQWKRGPFGIGSNGFALSRAAGADQPLVDPGYGLASWASWSFKAFGGELGVTLRGEVDAVGSRENEPNVPAGATDSPDAIAPSSPAYLTSQAMALVTIGDIIITVRMRNLEDVPRPETWIDASTGELALGPGRELRFTLTARLFN
jgi:hypothetical protein